MGSSNGLNAIVWIDIVALKFDIGKHYEGVPLLGSRLCERKDDHKNSELVIINFQTSIWGSFATVNINYLTGVITDKGMCENGAGAFFINTSDTSNIFVEDTIYVEGALPSSDACQGQRCGERQYEVLDLRKRSVSRVGNAQNFRADLSTALVST